MAWLKDAISDGEIDALRRAALSACNEDTRYPLWRGSHVNGAGECYNVSRWLVSRLGGSVGAQRGHYVWLSPDQAYYLDLTGRHAQRQWAYDLNRGAYHRVSTVDNERTAKFIKRADRIFESLDALIRLSLDYAGDAYPAEEPQAADDSARFNDSWNDPDNYWHDEPDATAPEGVYQFVYANGQLEVSPNHGHAELASHAGIPDPATHAGPFAAGHVVVTSGQATWEVQSNVNLHSFLRILKDASKQYGWRWGGMTDSQGQPISEVFAPKGSSTSYHYVYANNHLYVGHSSPAHLAALANLDDDAQPVVGALRVAGDRVEVSNAYPDILPSLFDWAADNGLKLFAGNDNVIKTIPDLQEGNNYNPEPNGTPNPSEPSPPDERLPTGLYRCPACSELFPNWHEYQKHRREQESWGDPDRSHNGDRGLPTPDPGLYGDGAHFTEMRQEPGITTGSVVLRARSWKEAARVDGFMKYATAFSFDNDSHHFYVAYHTGDPVGYAAVTPDGGITMMHTPFEGKGVAKALYGAITQDYDELYTHAAHEKTAGLLKRYGWIQVSPVRWRWAREQAASDLLESPMPFIYDVDKDKVFVGHPGARTSDIPGKFTPGGIVEGVYEPGGKVVLRSMTSVPYTVRHLIELWYYTQPTLEVKSVHLQDDAGRDTRLATLKELVAMSPAVHLASNALMKTGAIVYAVGGAIRDLQLGKEPSDIDLLVTGLSGTQVEAALKKLPGRVVQEGKCFAVFHYRHKGHEVHIAIPRRERSTGPEHTAFVVESENVTPEEDLYRRDFTVNAMACDLRTGQLLDPYHGTEDIETRTLRTLGPHSFQEDPLRVLRGLAAVSRHGLVPDEETRTQMREAAQSLDHLPGDRLRDELDKILAGDDPVAAIRLAHETDALEHFLPEVAVCMGYDQNNPHHELDLGAHLLGVLGRTCQLTTDVDVRLAALLHDIGKPGSAWKDPERGTNHYYARYDGGVYVEGANHEELGAEMVAELMRRLRYPNERIARVKALVSHHMYDGFTTLRGARRFLAKVGNHADDLFIIRQADSSAKSLQGDRGTAWNPHANRELVAKVRQDNQAVTLGALAIDGNDLIAAGVERGPEIGRTLKSLMAKVIENPELNQRETLLELITE